MSLVHQAAGAQWQDAESEGETCAAKGGMAPRKCGLPAWEEGVRGVWGSTLPDRWLSISYSPVVLVKGDSFA